MSAELKICNRASALAFGSGEASQEPPLEDFFRFWRNRKFSNPAVLSDCSLYDVFITYYVRDWPGPSLPDPSFFEEFFPAILRRLVGSDNTLALYVKSSDPGYFEELEAIKSVLSPRSLPFVLLPREGPPPDDPRFGPNVGHLIFEWPVNELKYVVENWFMCPQVEIEGYISKELPLAPISELYFRPDTEERIREILRTIEIGFRLWRDNNGLFVLTDKVDLPTLTERLNLAAFNHEIKEAAQRYSQTP
jgi:hypothetical protein